MSQAIDPFAASVIQESLLAIGDEMFAALKKTAMSPIIYEVLDAGTAVTLANGDLAASGSGIPTFVGVLDKAVKRILELQGGPEAIKPGDLFVTNDPYYGGVTHLNDVVLALPVFAGDRLVAWTANIAHWNDVSGRARGSMSTEATEIWQEGLRLPAVRLFENGEILAPVMDIIKTNSRLPDFVEGDLWAGIAAARTGERALLALVDKYGVETFVTALDDYLDLGERTTRAGMADLPQGTFEIEETQDNGEIWRATIEIGPDSFTVDLTDNPDQSAGPYNTSRDGAVIAAQMILKSTTAPQTPMNAGSIRPLTVLTRPGSRFHAQEPAPHGFYFETRIRLHDLLCRCLAPHLPDRLPAGGFASICGTFISGRHPDTGRPFTMVEPEVGGWGATRDRDGTTAMFSNVHGETFNCPAEITEARYGLVVARHSLNTEPGGNGTWRGGRGIVVDYAVRADGTSMTCGYSRAVEPPWGMEGGEPGTPNRVEVLRKDGGGHERYAMASEIPLNEGDTVRITTGQGGGYGPPEDRIANADEKDRRDGLR
ncbi:MAG: hydantoinase B/oxoprolinase family protein [Pseudomonadota bacterium]